MKALNDHNAVLRDDDTVRVLAIDNLQQLLTKPMRKHKLFESDRHTPLKLASPTAAHVAQLVFVQKDEIDAIRIAQSDANFSPMIMLQKSRVRLKFLNGITLQPKEIVTVRARACVVCDTAQGKENSNLQPHSLSFESEEHSRFMPALLHKCLGLTSGEADVLRLAMHEFIGYALTLRHANGSSIG